MEGDRKWGGILMINYVGFLHLVWIINFLYINECMQPKNIKYMCVYGGGGGSCVVYYYY